MHGLAVYATADLGKDSAGYASLRSISATLTHARKYSVNP
jgi:hypothetical protein